MLRALAPVAVGLFSAAALAACSSHTRARAGWDAALPDHAPSDEPAPVDTAGTESGEQDTYPDLLVAPEVGPEAGSESEREASPEAGGAPDAPAAAGGPDTSSEGAGSVDSTSAEAALRCGFVPTGDLTVPRMWYAAALLNSGNVLVAGGSDNDVAPVMLASAEIYDAAAGTFTATGSLQAPRRDHTATALLDGKVLIAGGMSTQTYLASAELFDADSGTFAPTGSMGVRRLMHTATLLPNGKVLVAGGWFGDTQAELYDPDTGQFAATGSMVMPRYSHTATLLPNGKVLIAGGERAPSSAEEYDPQTGEFAATGDLTTPRSLHTATRLPNGRVLLAGGLHSASAELYDPVTRTFAATGSMSEGRSRHAATLLPNGMVLITGGESSSGSIAGADQAELYDPAPGIFTATGSLAVPRVDHAAILLPNGKVLIPGSCADRFFCGSAELFQCP